MINFSATKKWYELAAQSEADVVDISAGPSTLSISNVTVTESMKNIKQIRKLEGFSTLLKMLRLNKGLSFEKLSFQINVNIEELILLEKQVGYKSSTTTLLALARFYSLPEKLLLQIGDATNVSNSKIDEEVIRFAAESESVEKLSPQEKYLLDRTIEIISSAPPN